MGRGLGGGRRSGLSGGAAAVCRSLRRFSPQVDPVDARRSAGVAAVQPGGPRLSRSALHVGAAPAADAGSREHGGLSQPVATAAAGVAGGYAAHHSRADGGHLCSCADLPPRYRHHPGGTAELLRLLAQYVALLLVGTALSHVVAVWRCAVTGRSAGGDPGAQLLHLCGLSGYFPGRECAAGSAALRTIRI